MFQAIYNSLSGLFSFSKALDTISNNVANMNTPGFRGSDSFFENVEDGNGSRISGTGLRTTTGQTQNATDASNLAITGGGFFILRDPLGNLFYTRAGQFTFDNGVLIDSVTHYDVMSIDASGTLSTFDISALKTLPAVATTKLKIAGNISSVHPLGQPGPPVTLSKVTITDAQGGKHDWTIKLTPLPPPPSSNDPFSWAISVTDEKGAAIPCDAASNVITFTTGSGNTPLFPSTFDFTANVGGKSQKVTLDFGVPGSQQSSGNPGAGDNATAQAVDGSSAVGIAGFSFDTNGVMQITYQGMTTPKPGPQVALASFASESALQLLGGRLVSGAEQKPPLIGHPGAGVFGTIKGGSLELSDVDLTQEFATMIVIQRGYQASSRVMTVSNQMLEDLYNNSQGGGHG